MKKVIVFDSYRRVYDEEGQLLHDADNLETIVLENVTFEEACIRVSELLELTKTIGDTYNMVVDQPNEGVVEIQVEFADKRFLHRVIYLKDA